MPLVWTVNSPHPLPNLKLANSLCDEDQSNGIHRGALPWTLGQNQFRKVRFLNWSLRESNLGPSHRAPTVLDRGVQNIIIMYLFRVTRLILFVSNNTYYCNHAIRSNASCKESRSCPLSSVAWGCSWPAPGAPETCFSCGCSLNSVTVLVNIRVFLRTSLTHHRIE